MRKKNENHWVSSAEPRSVGGVWAGRVVTDHLKGVKEERYVSPRAKGKKHQQKPVSMSISDMVSRVSKCQPPRVAKERLCGKKREAQEGIFRARKKPEEAVHASA